MPWAWLITAPPTMPRHRTPEAPARSAGGETFSTSANTVGNMIELKKPIARIEPAASQPLLPMLSAASAIAADA